MRISGQTSMLIRAADRRNHFAREGLRRALLRRIAAGELDITAPGAARVFQLPQAMCERLLEELTNKGALVRSPGGAYAVPR